MGRPMKDSGVEWIGEIPEQWETIKGKYLYSVKKGKLPNLYSSNINGDYLPYLSMEYQRSGGNPKEYASKKDGLMVNAGDITVLWDGSNAGEFFKSREGILSSTVALIKTNALVESDYMYFSLKASEEDLKTKNTGMGIPHVNGNELKNNFYPMPPIEKQKEIVNKLTEKTLHIESIIEKTKASIDSFKRYKQALITETVTKGLNPDVPMKDSGIEWMGTFPEHWEIRKIKDFIEFDPPKSEIKESDFEKECTFLPMENLRNGKMNLIQTRKIKDVYSGYSYFIEGDIVLAKVTPCFENGNIAVSRGLENGVGFGTTEIFTIRPISIDVNFLFYRLQEEIFVEKGKSTMYGVGGLKRLSPEFIRSYKIAVPPFDEQQQIATYLDEKTAHIDSLIQNKEAMIEKLEAYKKSLIYEYVTGKKEVE